MEPKNKTLKHIAEAVYKVLEEDTSARNDDRKLYVLVCKKLGLNVNVSLSDWSNANSFPSTESVRRSRQKIQAMGLFLPSEEVQKNRDKNEQKFYDFSKLHEQEFNFG